MANALSDFLRQPTAEHLLALRALIVSLPGFDPLSEDDARLAELIDAATYLQAAEFAEAMMPNWLLSARVQLLVARAAEHLGDAEGAAQARYVARACLHATLQAGDGSAERPYPVLYASDEYDVLAVLAKEPAGQRFATRAGGRCDVIVATDGSETWFDIGAGLQAAERTMRHG